jgi:hypothetical protein
MNSAILLVEDDIIQLATANWIDEERGELSPTSVYFKLQTISGRIRDL